MLMIGKFGLSGAFNIVYLANSIFPVLYATTTMGICSLFSRGVTIFAPMIAEIEGPYPMMVYGGMAGISMILSFFLNVTSK